MASLASLYGVFLYVNGMSLCSATFKVLSGRDRSGIRLKWDPDDNGNLGH
eukprot:CAMPEP_0119339644 /NCGR_PEP_ID=MMETSP1333-20130426/98688_1 /TAXON_ID=418940 /ORGANISM="Scyphosphaera apsteinii, Strain RCC1455" /LENGTH=49 /DNA_ID=CAMNT_0007351205 /DNA_START=356 /DNA_END=505 /DNA_ORIENTATION=-